MKYFRLSWMGIVNILLIILPWIVFSTLIYQFGQPVLNFYRNYFLGNPVAEIKELTLNLSRNPRRDIPFRQLSNQYKGVIRTNKLTDTQFQELQTSTVYLHHAITQRTSPETEEKRAKLYSDSYVEFLRSESFRNIFGNQEQIIKTLKKDIERLRALNDYPDHPADGLNQFIESLNSATNLIRTYGDIYANQVACENIFKTSCNKIYDPSIEIISKQLEQYFRNWPDFGGEQTASMRSFQELLTETVVDFRKNTKTIGTYFQNPPWHEKKSLQGSFDQFQEQFKMNVRRWYLSLLGKIRINSDRFRENRWDQTGEMIDDYRKIEHFLNTNPEIRNWLVNESVKKNRESFFQLLLKTYENVKVLGLFDPDFAVAEDGLVALEKTLEAYPDGERLIRRRKNVIRDVKQTKRRLDRYRKERNYHALLETLEEVRNKLSGDHKDFWRTMLRRFVEHSRDKITTPIWQPKKAENIDSYRNIIREYVQIATKLKISGMNEEWLQETFNGLKSRQFNKLKFKLLDLLENVRRNEWGRIEGILQDMINLNELPRSLKEQTREIIFQTALIEYIKFRQNTIFSKFNEITTKNSRKRTLWKKMVKLMEPQNEMSSIDRYKQLNFKQYAQQTFKWLNEFERSDSIDDYMQTVMIDELHNTLLENNNTLINQIRKRWMNKPRRNQFIKWGNRLNEGFIVLNSRTEQSIENTTLSWIELLEVRNRFSSIRKFISEMQVGSVFETNQIFQEYQQVVSNYEADELPNNYNYGLEKNQLISLHQYVLNRTDQILRQSRSSIFGSWGGRIDPAEILEGWKLFLKKMESAVKRNTVKRRIQDLIRVTNDRQKRIKE